MNYRDALVDALATITAARRAAQDDYDACLTAKLSAPPSHDEQDEQCLASIARLLGEAAKAVRDAVACSDRRALSSPGTPT